MLHQRSPAVPRLAVAEFLTGTEGVHGASWRDHEGTGEVLPATVFPQPPGIAASWDPELARDIGRATGRGDPRPARRAPADQPERLGAGR